MPQGIFFFCFLVLVNFGLIFVKLEVFEYSVLQRGWSVSINQLILNKKTRPGFFVF